MRIIIMRPETRLHSRPNTFSQTVSRLTQFFLHSGGGPYMLRHGSRHSLWNINSNHCQPIALHSIDSGYALETAQRPYRFVSEKGLRHRIPRAFNDEAAIVFLPNQLFGLTVLFRFVG